MAKVLKALVFCSDKIPSKGNSTSGGGIRSFQIMKLLSSLDIQVSFVIPEGSKYKCDSSAFEFLGFYNLANQTEFIGGQVYDMVWWCNPGTIDSELCKKNPGILKCVDFHGPINLETIFITGESLGHASNRIAENLHSIDFFTFVSEEQKSYWMGLLSCAGVDPTNLRTSIVNLALQFQETHYSVKSKVRFAFVGGWHPWLFDEKMLLEIAEVIASEQNAELHFLGGAHKFCKDKYSEFEQYLRKLNSVYFHGFLPHEEFHSFMNQSSCALDLFSKTYERKLALSTRTVEFLSQGIPVIHPKWSSLAKIIEKADCGFVYNNSKDVCEMIRLISKCPEKLKVVSANSSKAIYEDFNFENARLSLKFALSKSVPELSTNSRPLEPTRYMLSEKLPKVLCITFIPEGEPLRTLRVEAILYDLYKSGLIMGFGILSGGCLKVVGSVDSFDVVYLQREGTDNPQIRSKIFRDKFILDIDDLLFANATHREADFLRWKDLHFEQTQELVDKCFLLSVTSARLSNLIKEYTGTDCLKKFRVTPNCITFPSSTPQFREGKAEALIWTSSDFAALGDSRDEIMEACVAFCRDKNLPLFLFGRFSEELSSKFSQIRNFGMTNFLVHKQILDQLYGKAIAVAPLETKADKQTLDFISGKSDLKMVEYGGFGIEAIYSNSPPYAESDLMSRHLAENNFEEWKTSLESAYERPAIPTQTILDIKEKRNASTVSVQTWLQIFLESQRNEPITVSDIESLSKKHSDKPLIKVLWSKCVPKAVRKKLDPVLEPIFG